MLDEISLLKHSQNPDGGKLQTYNLYKVLLKTFLLINI